MNFNQENLFNLDQSNEENLDTFQWSKIIKKRNKYRCTNEKKYPHLNHEIFELNSHHIKPKYLGGKNTIENGIVFCRACHAAQHPEYYGVFKDVYRKINEYLDKIINFFFGFKTNFRYINILEFLTGKNKFRYGQLEAIKTIYENKKHVFVVMPTGSGKSIIFQIVGILGYFKNTRPTIVFEPLNELQKDQVFKLLERWIPTTYINSDLKKYEIDERVKGLLSNEFIFLYIHPKQLLFYNEKNETLNIKTNKQILNLRPNYLVIDESHVVERYGLTFVKEYFYLKKIYEHYNYPQVILLTATASKKTREFIKENLGLMDDEIVEIVTGFYRSEIKLETYKVDSYFERDELLRKLLINKPFGKTIIFCTTKKQVDHVYDLLKNDFELAKFHSELSQKEKELNSKRFQGKIIEEEVDIMVSTSAYGMGIDIPNIHQVIHYSLPFSITDYYQQIGRAGRDGEESVCQLIYLPLESTNTVDFINEKILEKENNENMKNLLKKIFYIEKNAVLEYVNKYTNEERWRFILDYFGDANVTKTKFFNFINFIIIILIIIYLLMFIFIL